MKAVERASVVSADGTRIAFDRVGEGPPLILVEPALHYREFSALNGLIPLLAGEFAVISYDRRGRGESTDTPPFYPEREVEDLEALIADAGGFARVYGFSSGALLALHAATLGVPISRLAVLEPPLRDDDAVTPDPLTTELALLIATGRRGDAVNHFHRSIGVPDEFVQGMKVGAEWARMESVAHTLVYDCVILETITSSLLQSVNVPTLVLDSENSTDNLTGWAATVAGHLPRGSHRSLPGEWHGIPDQVLAPVLADFFNSDSP